MTNLMTPTEQDDELREKIRSALRTVTQDDDPYLQPAEDVLVNLFTRYAAQRVAEALANELEYLQGQSMNLYTSQVIKQRLKAIQSHKSIEEANQ